MVKEYTCEKCGKIFDQKSHFIYHLNRKTPCDKYIEYTCEKCDKVFNKKSTYENHLKRKNPCKKIDKITTDIDIIKKIIDEMKIKNDKEMNELKKKNEELEEIVKKIGCKNETNNSYNNTTNNTTNNTMNNVTVVINAFGKEDLSHLTKGVKRRILDRGFQSIPKYIELVHFNDKKPANKNVCISNRRDNTVNIYDGKKWTLTDKKEFLTDIKEKGIDFIERNIEDLDKDNVDDAKILKKIGSLLKEYSDGTSLDEDINIEEKERGKNMIRNLDKTIQFILYNNRDIMHS